jgi:hypothetical protein
MAITSTQISAYATYFLPTFQFADSERIYPLKADVWLMNCAQGNWNDTTDPHRGAAAVIAPIPLSLATLSAKMGCSGESGAPIDPAQTLPFGPGSGGAAAMTESFIDYAGWTSLESGDGFTSGDDDYIRSSLAPYFAQFNPALAGETPPVRSSAAVPTSMTVYCEAAWAGSFTRLDLKNETMDFAPAANNGAAPLAPDPALDAYFVLTYYLFFPATEPPPSIGSVPVTSPNSLQREGQWEAVSFYFASSQETSSEDDLVLPVDPSQAAPAYVMLSQGITISGDGVSNTSTGYPAALMAASYLYAGTSLFLFVTSGTHKFLPSTTSAYSFDGPPVAAQSPPLEAAASTLGSAAGIVAGTTGGTGVGLLIGAVLAVLAGLLALLGADEATGSADTLTSTDAADASGDVANSGGGLTGPASASSSAGGAFVPVDLETISLLPDAEGLSAPAWWSYPGRWGIAVSSSLPGWDSGGRRIDFIGRSRAYWNSVWLQHSL